MNFIKNTIEIGKNMHFVYCRALKVFYFLLLFLVLTANLLNSVGRCEPLQANIQYTSRPYIVGPGDLLSVSVHPQEEYGSQNILVRSDGKISFPNIGEVPVSGHTVDEITLDVKRKLSRCLKNADILVAVSSPRPISVYLMGAVFKPGSFQMSINTQETSNRGNNELQMSRFDPTLTNILINAGGVSTNADLSRVEVTRSTTGTAETVNLLKLLKEGSIEEDLWLNNNDKVFVPKLASNFAISDEDFQLLMRSSLGPKTFPVRVLGEVKQADVIELSGQTPYLNSAISKAGGYAPQAERGMVAIRRFTAENKFTTMYVNPALNDFILRPNDVVFIGENRVYKSGRFMQQAALVLSPFQTVGLTAAYSAQAFGLGGWSRKRF